ncbi:unnamed protein product [Lymnaea stagnalis]|uniref:MICOS complex subunit MIC60 n=1 Tax=Lymnaea stagnalis TaxID=6523 RepID=A0AAV2HK49_LYMST
MWRVRTSSQSRQILKAAKRQLATDPAPLVKPNNLPPQQSLPPKSGGGFRIFKFFGFGLPVAAGSLLGYAWYDHDFRKQLEANIPYAKELLGNILPESNIEPVIDRKAKPDTSKSLEKPSIPTIPTILNNQEKVPQIVPQNTGVGSDNESVDSDDEEEDNDDISDSFRDKVLENKEVTNLVQTEKPNPFEDMKDPEKELTEEIIQSRSNPLQEFTGVIPVQNQAYQTLQVQRVEDLLSENDPDAPNTEGNLGTALAKDMIKKEEKIDGKIDPRVIDSHIRKREDDEKADNAALEVVIHKLMTSSQNLTEEAIQAQRDLAASIRSHTKLLKQAMDDSSDILQKDAQWEAVAISHKERERAMLRANELALESKRSLEKLRDVITESKTNNVTKQNPAILPASKKVNDLLKDLNSANTQVRQAEAEANVMQKYKELVDKGRKQFQKEIESLMPDVKIGTGKKLTEDELNALIAHAHRRIEQLQRQIAEQLAMERQRLSVALEAQRQEDLHITDSAVAEERSRLQEEFDVEKQKMELEFLMKIETEVRKQLSRQAAAHSDHLKDVLTIQQQQLGKEFNRELNAKLLEEREKFQSEVASWISRLKGIEAAVDARAAGEKLARSAQNLWLACISLTSAINYGDENSSQEQHVPLRARVEAILSSSQKHPFVETVANSIPRKVLDRGVSTEDQLKHRFFRVSKICRRLGLIKEPNTSLYKYLISYLHSMVVFDNIVAVSEYDEIDLNSLDNFAILAYAQYWMERGNINIALRFMSHLTGEPRRAASDWINEAKLLLETKQSAYALTAYASASGLANTF